MNDLNDLNSNIIKATANAFRIIEEYRCIAKFVLMSKVLYDIFILESDSLNSTNLPKHLVKPGEI